MAEEEKVLLKLEIEGTDQELKSIEAIRAEMLRTQNVLREMKRDSRKGVFVDQQALVKEEKNLKILGNEYRQLQRQQVAATEAANTAQKEGVRTISTMRAQLTRLKKDWSDIEVGSKAWDEHTQKIRVLSDEIQLAEMRTGNFTRNVGNYAGDFQRAFGAMGVSTGRFGQALMFVGSAQSTAVKGTMMWIRSLSGLQKALVATGIGAFVVALGLVLANLDKLKLMFQTNEQRAEAYAESIKSLRKAHEDMQAVFDAQLERLELLGVAEDELIEKRRINTIQRIKLAQTELLALSNMAKIYEQKIDDSGYFGWLFGTTKKRKEKLAETKTQMTELEAIILSLQNSIIKGEQERTKIVVERRKQESAAWNEQRERLERELELSEKLKQSILDRADARAKEKKQVFVIPGLEPEAAVAEGSASPVFDAELAAVRAMNDQIIISYQDRYRMLDEMVAGNLITEQQAAARKIELAREVSEITLAEMGYMFSGLRAALGEQTQAGKTAGIAEAIINTIRAGMQVYADPSLPLFAKLAAMVGVLAQGYAQVNKIRQVKTNFAAGVIGVDGPGTGTSDSINARISRGESVITAKATSKFAPQLAAMETAVGNTPNYQLGRKRYASGIIAAGMGVNGDTMKAQQRMMRDLMRNVTQIPVVVSERDITGTQAKVRKVKVSGNI